VKNPFKNFMTSISVRKWYLNMQWFWSWLMSIIWTVLTSLNHN